MREAKHGNWVRSGGKKNFTRVSSVPVPPNLAWHSSTLFILCMKHSRHIPSSLMAGHWWSTDHFGDWHRNSPVVSTHQAKNGGRTVKNAIFPAKNATNTQWFNKELVCFSSLASGPTSLWIGALMGQRCDKIPVSLVSVPSCGFSVSSHWTASVWIAPKTNSKI